MISEELPGLRARKKQQTRAALSEAALRLALERGVANVRIEDIAAAANVSMRTFNNYFASKEAAIAGSAGERVERIEAALAGRPQGEPLEQSIREAVLAGFPENPDQLWVARVMLLRGDEALAAEQYKADASVERVLADAIANRAGAGIGAFRARLMAATAVAAVRTAISYWLERSDDRSLHQILADALSRLHVRSDGAAAAAIPQ